MSDALKGACLCGSVEYEVQEPESLGYCHCTRCQRWTGGSLAGVVVAKENFTFTKGEDLVKTYESEFAPRNFCSNCGSSIYDDLGEKYFVAAGLMRELRSPSFTSRSHTRPAGTRRRTPAVRREPARLTGGAGGDASAVNPQLGVAHSPKSLAMVLAALTSAREGRRVELGKLVDAVS